jgi:hypothetical protein
MNPLVEAATIGVTGTVIVGVAGFGAAAWSTRKTIREAHDARVWDKRAEVYAVSLAAMHYRYYQREYDTHTEALDDATEQRLRAFLATYSQPDWYMIEARMLAFSSAAVFTAMQASSTAHGQAVGAFTSWRDAEPGSEDSSRLLPAVAETRKAASAADGAVAELMRAELQGKGRQISDWQPAS